MRPAPSPTEIPLRRAALVAGLGLLAMTVAALSAELLVFPRLLVQGDGAATLANLKGARAFFAAGLFGHLVTFLCDIVVAWALYYLLAPVSRSLSRLAAWFRLIYTAFALSALGHLFTLFRKVFVGDPPSTGDAGLGEAALAHFAAFRAEWNTSLLVFGAHLLLVAWLMVRSGYLPRWLGGVLALAGAAYWVNGLGPYFYPHLDLGFLRVLMFGELVFMVWLLVRGRTLREPAAVTL